MRTLYPGVLGIACCAFVLICPTLTIAQTRSTEPAAKEAAAIQLDNGSSAELPDSPGAILAQNSATLPQSQSPTAAGAASPDEKSPDQKVQRPVGTAAAEAPKVTGITAAEPAGVAIAPAKQRRVRTIVLKVGAIVGGAAALGTVIALTAATPSKPPGAH
ncbi:MAG TPA: hypothetical protein VGS27_27435 [Candidatus Sulfotelmatobacter sp.]|nr:hypothetical protein [Candidatus Sulfotelmatobacter sp.]